jgi:hypothetical protein
MLVLPQQMAQVEAFVASLPPAVVQLLSLLYDNNSELSQQLMARNNTIQQLKLVGTSGAGDACMWESRVTA